MEELLEWMDYIEDSRQQAKVWHKLKDIIVIVLFATLANVDDWVEMEYFSHYHEAYLKKYIELKNEIPFHVHSIGYSECCHRKCYNSFMANDKNYWTKMGDPCGSWSVSMEKRCDLIKEEMGSQTKPYRNSMEPGRWIQPWSDGGWYEK